MPNHIVDWLQDWTVGQLMETIRTSGLEDNTVFVFLSDNGPFLEEGHEAGTAGAIRDSAGHLARLKGEPRTHLIVDDFAMVMLCAVASRREGHQLGGRHSRARYCVLERPIYTTCNPTPSLLRHRSNPLF